MKKSNRYILVLSLLSIAVVSVLILYLNGLIEFQNYLKDWFFYVTVFVSILLINEGFNWANVGKRSEMADLVYIAFFFVVVYLFTRDILNSFIGAFSIYLLIGIAAFKDYKVINKLMYISVITYNFIFFMGLVTFYTDNPVWRDTAYSFSFWLILILGFAFFGRKYIVIWRFMSTQYLILGLYLIAWVGVFTVTKYTPYNLYEYIYEILICTNVVVYFITGPVIDKMLGLKPVDDPRINEIIAEVAPKFGFDPKKIKVRFGQYPIINAMAYGSIFDRHMAIIAPSLDSIPKDEMKGIVAHELAHHRGKHTLTLTIITCLEIFIRKLLRWPVSTYDYTFNPDQPYSMFWFIIINIVVAIFLYIFVRDLEARADREAKRAGYAIELAKGLYNLESFYSYGREIGLNTMLLCDDKLEEYNRQMDYITTASYIKNYLIKPTNSGLLSNLLNSHPPSYHRIFAVLDEKSISPLKQSLLPFVLMKTKKKMEFAKKTKDAREKFLNIAQIKFKEEFGISEMKNLYDQFKLIEQNSMIKGDSYIITSNYTGERKFVKFLGYEYSNSIGTTFLYKMIEISKDGKDLPDSPSNKPVVIDPSDYTLTRVKVGEKYVIPKEGVYELISCDVNSDVPSKKDKKERKKWAKEQKKKQKKDKNYESKVYPKTGEYIFIKNNSDKSNKSNENDGLIKKPIKHFKLPFPITEVDGYVGKQAYYGTKGTLKVVNLSNVQIGSYNEKIKNVEVSVSLIDSEDVEKVIKTPNLLIRRKGLGIELHKDKELFKYEEKIIDHLISGNYIATIYLKKPINNEETGYIEAIIPNLKTPDKESSETTKEGDTEKVNKNEGKKGKAKENNNKKNESTIRWNLKSGIEFTNLMGNKMQIPYTDIEFITFVDDALYFANLAESSFSTTIGYKYQKRKDPSTIFL